MPIQPTRRSLLAGTAALAVVPLLAACGEPATSNRTGRSTGAEEKAFPATISHKFGTTEVAETPKKIVVVGLVEQDALLALGFVPIATSNWFGDAPGRIFSWATDALGDATVPTVLDPTDGIPIEEVRKLGPDLIIGLYSGMTEREYELLSDTAPTIAQSGDYVDYTMPWDETTLTIGTAVGRPQAAAELVDDVRGQIAQAAEDHPEFAGLKAACVTPYEGLFVYGPDDPRGQILGQLGFAFPESLSEVGNEDFGSSLSVENTTNLADLDAVVWLDYDDAPDGMLALFEKSTAFREGRWFSISDEDGDYYVAQSFVTPLSIPYVLENYVPQLAAAVDGDPATEPPTPARSAG